MRITARYYGFFSTLTKKLYEPVEVADSLKVKDLIEVLAKIYGYKISRLCFIRPLYSERDYVNINLNFQDLNSAQKYPEGLQTELNDGDMVSFGVIGGAA
jgi:molybdopterin converting factor small subunit